MPRLSSEARSAELWRERGTLPPPPKHLGREAAKVWAEIVASKPPGYFDPGSLVLLETYCGVTVALRKLDAKLRELDPQDREYGRLARLSATLAGTQGATAVRLRLAHSSRMRYEDGRLNEPALPKNRLLGRTLPSEDEVH